MGQVFHGRRSGQEIARAAIRAGARRARAEADRAKALVLAEAVAWARAHVVTDLEEAATWVGTPVPVAGVGAPLVAEFCVAEFAAAVGLGTEAGRRLIGQGLELGSTDSLDVRRAAAVGVLARGQLALGLGSGGGFETGLDGLPQPTGARVVEEGRSPVSKPPTRPVRDVVLYVHLNPADGTDIAEVEGHGLLTKTQIATWCGGPETRVIGLPWHVQ